MDKKWESEREWCGDFCCQMMYAGFSLGFFSMRGGSVTLNLFLKVQEGGGVEFNDFHDETGYIAPIIRVCPYCKADIDKRNIKSDEKMIEANEKSYKRRSMNSKVRESFRGDYVFCCEKIKYLERCGFLCVYPTPNTLDSYKEILINNFIVPIEAGNFLTGDLYDPDDFISSVPLDFCPFCETPLVQFPSINEVEEDIW